MRIINLIDNFTKVNFGIWNAAISTASSLKKQFGVDSELWYPNTKETPEVNDVVLVPLDNTSISSVNYLISSRNLSPSDCVIITHGCWQYPTRWGARFKKLGYQWMYVPHGMLEPWSLKQKKIQKKVYYTLIEGPYSRKADWVRAVGLPEYNNLVIKYKRLHLIANGIDTDSIFKDKTSDSTNYLFMARLHHKKGIVPLVKAWLNSPQASSPYHCLNIAGPDDGELNQVKQLVKQHPDSNINYIGAVYGEQKQELIDKSHIYLLPSYSEGFPTSVLEAMSNHLLAVITEGCNFPEAIQEGHVIQTTPQIKDIEQSLKTVFDLSQLEIIQKAKQGAAFVNSNYNLDKIAHQQYMLIT